MKGIQGLVIAVFLGVLGAIVNMYYLYKGRDIEVVEFIGVKPGAKIELGKPIRGEQLEKVLIPSANVGNLKEYAFAWEDRSTIYGWKASREFVGRGGELILREDLRTPPPHLTLKEGETVVWMTINTSTTVVSQLIPGETRISFYLPKNRGHTVGQPPAGIGVDQWEWVGPFEFLAVGTRMGDPDVMSANRVSTKQQNIVTLPVNAENETRVMDVYNYWHSSNYEPLAVKLHPPKNALERDN